MADILVIGYIINFLLILVMIFFERRDPVVSMAWILFFIVFPIGGLVIFLIFGHGLRSHTKKMYVQKQILNDSILNAFHHNDKNKCDCINKKHINVYKYLLNAAHNDITCDNDIRIITDGNEKFKMLLNDIENAKQSINMLYFIIHNDEIGSKIISTLTKKANEGVEVRLLYDAFGSFFTPRRCFNCLRKAPFGHVAEFFPVKLFSFSKLNHRNHRKIAVIDGKIAYLGGMNIGDEYLSKKKLVWRDTHMRITGSAVADIQKYFALDWEFSTGERLLNRLSFFFSQSTPTGKTPIQVVASGPDSDSDEIKCGMMKMINNAQNYVYIQTPYFVPDKSFLTAVTTAAESGVDVRVMIPGTPDKLYVYYTTLSYMGELLNAGVKVFLYPGFIHSKSIAVDDDICTMGTTNIDTRSFQLHFELNAFIYNNETCIRCREIFTNDQKKCRELTKETYRKRGLKTVICEGFFRLFSPLM